MKKITFQLILVMTLNLAWCQAQTNLPKVENHLNGELDYSYEALDLVQLQQNGKEIVLGKINTDGTIHFNLLEFDIKALFDSIPLQNYNLHQLFKIDSSCKDRDVFAETPYDAVYSQKYKLLVKKYGINVAILEPKNDERTLGTNTAASEGLVTSSNYFWFYIDRVIAYNEKCSKANSTTGAIYANINANIEFEKGWNFIEEKIETVQKSGKVDSLSTQLSKIQFSKISPANKKIKWSLRQILEDEKIETAKKLYELVPITKAQFKNWLPEKAGELTRTSYELDKDLDPSDSKSNNVFIVFKNGSQKMEIALLDGAKNPNDLEMAKFSFAMDKEYKRKDKPASDASINASAAKGEVHHISKENKEEKSSQIMSVFKDRIVLYANGENMTAVQLWETIKTLNIVSIID